MARKSACEAGCTPVPGASERSRPRSWLLLGPLAVPLLLGWALTSCGSSGPLYTTADSQVTTQPLTYADQPEVTTSPPVAGAPMTVSFTVDNNTYHILYGVPWLIYLDADPSQVIASGSIVQITPNGQTIETVQVTAPVIGTHTLTIVIDPQDVLQLGEASGPASTITVVTVAAPPG